MTESSMWVEKYRPMKLSEVVNQKEVVGSLKALLKNISEMPHLMFSGSAGVGKTTTALCIAREVLGDGWREYTLELNASDERGINMVRERVKKFARFSGLDTSIPFKLVILDEADEMTSDAQTPEEDHRRHVRALQIHNDCKQHIENNRAPSKQM